VQQNDRRPRGEIWREGEDLGLPPDAKFCIKNCLKEFVPGKFIPKIYQFGWFRVT